MNNNGNGRSHGGALGMASTSDVLAGRNTQKPASIVGSPVGASSDFIAGFQSYARVLRSLVPDATPQELRFLDEFCRQDAYRRGCGLVALRHLVNLAARSQQPRMLSELVWGLTMSKMDVPSLCIIDTLLTETRAQGKADEAQIGFAFERTAPRRDQALEEVTQHFHALRVQLDAYHAWAPNGRTYG